MPTTVSRPEQRDLTLSGFVIAAVIAAALVAGTYWLSLQSTRTQEQISHSHEVLAAIENTRANLVDLQNGARGYALTGRQDELQPYDAARFALPRDVQRLRSLTADNALQQRNVQALEQALQPRLAAAAAVVGARRSGGFRAVAPMVGTSAVREQMAALRDLMNRMEAEERRLLAQRLAQHDRRLKAFWAGMTALLAALLAALAVLYVQVRRKRAAQGELLESEQRFHAMTDSVTDYAILMLDPQGQVRSWNPGAHRIKGYTENEILGRHFSCFYTDEDVRAGKPAEALAAAAAQGRFTGEGWRLRRDGSRFWASVAITPLLDPAGHLTGYCKITRDLTDRKAAEDALRAEVRERERAQERLRELNAGLESEVGERTRALQQANAALSASKDRLQELSARLITAQEEERRHIARELHDETGQALTVIRLHLSELATQPAPGGKALAECTQLVDRAMQHIRGLSLRLRPPMLDDLGLADALEWVLEQQAGAAGWRTEFDAVDTDERLPQEMETACFRICQEALTNAARYARATEVSVTLRRDPQALELAVADNGGGFELERYRTPEERKKHFGLVSMTERAALAGGRLDIRTAPGQGTRVTLRFALDEEGRAAAGPQALPVAAK